jgi:hypothetical protein
MSSTNPHQNIKMTEEEKRKVWAEISAHTFDIPVRKPIISRLYYRGLLPALNRKSISSATRKYTIGVLLGSLVLSGGVSAFAQESLPGELLYPVKTNVIEKIKTITAVTPQAKASVEAVLAATRLEEIETLAREGKLNATLEQQMDNAFTGHVLRFERYLIELEADKQFDTVVELGQFFQTRIAVHAAVLNALAVTKPTESLIQESTHLIEDSAPTNIFGILEGKVFSHVVPTILITKEALRKAVSPTTSDNGNDFESISHEATLDIDSKEAEKYLIELRKAIGIPASASIIVSTSTKIFLMTDDGKRNGIPTATPTISPTLQVSAISTSTIVSTSTDLSDVFIDATSTLNENPSDAR